jgi:hypothetical protein
MLPVSSPETPKLQGFTEGIRYYPQGDARDHYNRDTNTFYGLKQHRQHLI